MESKSTDNLLLLRIDTLLKNIDLVLKDTLGLSSEELEGQDILLRATCFSIAQIGEMMVQLQKALSPRYPQLPWDGARGMRNTIVHDYGHADIKQIHSTIHSDLPKLKRSFLAVKNDLLSNCLITERLRLRKIRKEDAKSIFQNWASNEEVTKFLTWDAHKSIEDTNQVVKRWLESEDDPKNIRYIITLKDKDEPIGSIDIVGYRERCPEIGYCLSRSYWNNGYMTEACQTFIQYLFDIGFHTIAICADKNNVASNKVIIKCGFRLIGEEKWEHRSQFKPEPVVMNRYLIVDKR